MRIRDTGYGIPAEEIDHIFELFSQVPEHQKLTSERGLGVGLALSRRLAEMHGGSIEVTSEGLGHGSEFVLTLPVMEQVADANSSAEHYGDVGPARRVLVVDDNVDVAETLLMLIEA